jgi:hypothetical protein
MSCINGLAFQCATNDGFHLRIAYLARLTWPWFIEQPIYSTAAKTLPPLANRLDVTMKAAGDFSTCIALGKAQDDARTPRQSLCRLGPASPLLQLFLLISRQRRQWKAGPSHDQISCHRKPTFIEKYVVN